MSSAVDSQPTPPLAPPSRAQGRRTLVALVGASALAAGVALAARGVPLRVPATAADEPVLRPFVPPGHAGPVIALDPGHGAPSNRGNRSSLCEAEEDFTFRFARELSRVLAANGFAPVLLRGEGERVPYPLRLERAVLSGARALVSVHSDIRGTPGPPSPPFLCGTDASSPGFTVLYSDDRGAETAEDLALARAVSRELRGEGFLAYDGGAYAGAYAPDVEPGVFVDRHPPEKRLFLLRAAPLPAVLVETHHALDPGETLSFATRETAERFGVALARALAAAP